LEPWATEHKELRRLNSEITKYPKRYDGLLRVHYRLKRSPHDKCDRVETDGMEGYTVPAVYRPDKYLNSQKLYTDGQHGITVDGATESKNHVMLFNDGGLDHEKDPDRWLDAEITKCGAASIWAVIKSRDPGTTKNERTFGRFLTRLNRPLRARTIVCLDADDLRALGVEIGRSLSWEKSLKELVSNIQARNVLPDCLPAHLVVTFDYDAVAYLKIGKKRAAGRLSKRVRWYFRKMPPKENLPPASTARCRGPSHCSSAYFPRFCMNGTRTPRRKLPPSRRLKC
jgi:hypothetical protein